MQTLEALYLRSSGQGPALRVAAIVASHKLGRPEAAALQHIRRCNFATLSAVVTVGDLRPDAGRPCPEPPEAAQGQGPLLLRLLEACDRLVHPDIHAQLAPVDCSAVLDQVPLLPAAANWPAPGVELPAQTVAALRAAELDVILYFAGGAVPVAELADLGRCGIWTIQRGDAGRPCQEPVYFREVREGRLLTSISLLVHGKPPGRSHVLTRAQVATEHSLFRGKNCVRPTLTALTFVIRKLHELHEQGWPAVQARMREVPAPAAGAAAGCPSNADIVRFLAPRVAQRAARAVNARPWWPGWRIGFRLASRHKLIESADESELADFRWLPPPRRKYVADPFLLRRNGKLWVFFEEVAAAEKKGSLACMEMWPDGTCSESVRILSRPYHLSYPAVFEDGGEVFMIPETLDSGRVELYQATQFPYSWRKVRDLLAIRAVDSTPFFHEGRYWLFTSVVDPPEASYHLLLFSAERLDGEWKLHPSSPLSIDIRHARCAGAIVQHDGRMFRPAQECAPYYGHQLAFNQIVRLNEREYAERLVRQITPDSWPGLRGVHTYAVCGDVEAIDGQG